MTPAQNPEQEKQPPRASIVVVSYNRAALLRRCLEALEKSQGRETLQIIVVDNGSFDGSTDLAESFPNVQWVRLPKNFGLTKALNLGWRAADADYVLFLHDDTEVGPETVIRLAEVLDAHTDAAAACPLLVDAEGHPGPQLGKLPPDGEYRPADPGAGDLVPVDYARGAALMTRVFLIKAIRQIDERYGQFGSDADLAAQFRKASRKVLLVPELRVRHHGGERSSGLDRADMLLGQALFARKYLGFGAGLRALLASVLGPLASLQFGVLRCTLAGQKIDGTQS